MFDDISWDWNLGYNTPTLKGSGGGGGGGLGGGWNYLLAKRMLDTEFIIILLNYWLYNIHV